MSIVIQDPIAVLLGPWSVRVNLYSILFRLVMAVIMAAIIGCERSSKRHSAGLRTFILVSLGSAVAAVTDICL